MNANIATKTVQLVENVLTWMWELNLWLRLLSFKNISIISLSYNSSYLQLLRATIFFIVTE